MKRRSNWIVCVLVLTGWVLSTAGFGWPEEDTHQDPLPSWRGGAQSNKEKIIRFVNRVNETRSPDYVPVPERVAVFDMDGTIICERPYFLSMAVALQRLRMRAARQNALRNRQPYKAVIENDRAYIRRHFVQILLEAHSGDTQKKYMEEIQNFLSNETHPRWNRPYEDLIYRPMLELIRFLKERQFSVYIVSGSWQALVRSIGVEQLGLDPSHMIGTKVELAFEMKEGKAMFLRKEKEVHPTNLRKGKPIYIWRHIGRRPIFAFGNSRGDQAMFEYTDTNTSRTLILYLTHDDSEREYRYESGLTCRPHWLSVSMKNDFIVVFSGDH